MEIKVGGVYRTRGGARAVIRDTIQDDIWPFSGEIDGEGGIWTWRRSGVWDEHHLSKYDLVAPWEDNVAKSVPAKYNEDERGRLVNTQKTDAVFQPSHYTRLYPEPITVINAWGLNFNLGSAVKYISRNGHKDGNTAEQDLSKAKRFIEIELERLRREKAIESGEAARSLLVETL